jgi:hypothetical protein
MKPTREQFEAVEAVALAMSALTEIWDEDFNTIYEKLGEDITGDLLTRSFDEMTWAWHGFRYALGDLTKTANKFSACKCGNPNLPHLIDDGGYPYC